MKTDKSDVVIYQRKEGTAILVSLMSSLVHAGFESPSTDHIEDPIDLNRYVSNKPYATFYAKVIGDCMIGSGIHEGDLVVVDRSLTLTNGDVIIGVLDGEKILRSYYKEGSKHYLMADNPKYKPILIADFTEFKIWGIVPHTIVNQRQQRNDRLIRLQQFLR